MIMIGEQTVADSPLISWPLNGQACIWWQSVLLPCVNYILLMQLDVKTCIVRGFISSVMITWIPKSLLDNVVILPPDMN